MNWPLALVLIAAIYALNNYFKTRIELATQYTLEAGEPLVQENVSVYIVPVVYDEYEFDEEELAEIARNEAAEAAAAGAPITE